MENTDYESPLKNTTGSAVLGSGDFIQTIKNEFFKDKRPKRDLPGMKAFISSLKRLRKRLSQKLGKTVLYPED